MKKFTGKGNTKEDYEQLKRIAKRAEKMAKDFMADDPRTTSIMSNKNKIILDLCGGTGAWSKPYKEAGYDVRNITLPESDIRKFAFTGDGFLTFFDTKPNIKVSDIYGILAAPPCTEFSIAKGSRPRDLQGGMEIVNACMQIIWKVRVNCKLKFWALENPVGLLRQFLGIPAYTFQPWWFGDNHSKRTDLWGYFNTPRQKVFIEPQGLFDPRYKNKANGRAWTKPPCPPEYTHLGLDRAALRAITPAGFANAFFETNQKPMPSTPKSMMSKKPCSNCMVRKGGSIRVSNVAHPHCVDCGRCIDRRCD